MTAFPFLIIKISEYLDYSVYLYMYNHVLPQFSIKKYLSLNVLFVIATMLFAIKVTKRK